jgi:hypothetical protein
MTFASVAARALALFLTAALGLPKSRSLLLR